MQQSGGFTGTFTSLQEAFDEPLMAGVGTKKPKKHRKHDVPAALPGTPAASAPASASSSAVPEPLQGAPKNETGAPPQPSAASGATTEAFTLPGETASADEWNQAFTLGPSSVAFPIDGQSTSWRRFMAPAPAPAPVTPSSPVTPISSSSLSNIPYDIQKRFDQLAQQLEGLTAATPMQNTAELFLFIAIGLLFILGIDTLIRCAVQVALGRSGVRAAVKGVRLRR